VTTAHGSTDIDRLFEDPAKLRRGGHPHQRRRAAAEAVSRLIHPQTLEHLWALAAAGVLGFVDNEIAAQVRLPAGRGLSSPALIAEGFHARTDGFVSLAVVASAAVVALGFKLGDPIIGLVTTLVILRITWQSIQTIKTDHGVPEPVEHAHG
jgi:divalent metal cation (Fe/Co/Zn/Cd) transporter